MSTYAQIDTADETFLLRDPFTGVLAHRTYLVGDTVDEDGHSVLWQNRTRIVLIDPAAVTGRVPLYLDPQWGLTRKAIR